MKNLLSKVWWEAAGGRALRTAIVVAIPYIPASYTGQTPYITILSAAVLAAILSLLTSLAGLPEVEGKQTVWWFAIVERVVKTVAQAAIAAVGNAVLFQDVHWSAIGQIAITAGFGSLLLAFLKDLPEANVPLAQVTSTVVVNNPAPVEQVVPVVAPVPAPAPATVPPVVTPNVTAVPSEAVTKETPSDEPTA